jgi:uncharacterized protein YkwD
MVTHAHLLSLLVIASALGVSGCVGTLEGTDPFSDGRGQNTPDVTPSDEDRRGGEDAGGVPGDPAGEDAGDPPEEDTGASEPDVGEPTEEPGPMCGDGVRDPDEACDGDCPSACDDSDACTQDSLEGAASTCDAVCRHDPVTACQSGDGCCAPGCDSSNDDDCAIDCTDASAWPDAWTQFEDEVVRLVNIERAAGADCNSRGTFDPAGPVTMQEHLRQSARCHSMDMAAENYFSHTGLNGSRFWERNGDAGYTGSSAGENIAANQSSPAAVVSGWMTSDGHCANIMAGGISTMGIGFVDDRYVDDSMASGGGRDWGRLWTMTTGR